VYGGIGHCRLLGGPHLFRPDAVIVDYHLKNRASEPVRITVSDPYGQALPALSDQGEAGIISAQWNMRSRAAGTSGARGGGMGISWVDPGEYVVTLEAAGRKLTKKALIRYRQGWTVGAVPGVVQKWPGRDRTGTIAPGTSDIFPQVQSGNRIQVFRVGNIERGLQPALTWRKPALAGEPCSSVEPGADPCYRWSPPAAWQRDSKP